MKFETHEENECPQKTEALRRALSWLIWTWLGCPGSLAAVAVLIDSTSLSGDWLFPVGVLYILGCIGVSSYFLSLSSHNRTERLKVLAIPGFFVSLAFFGVGFGFGPLGSFGSLGLILIAPVWLGEILRYKALRRGLNTVASLFLAHHALTIFLTIAFYTEFGAERDIGALGFLWYFFFPLTFFVMRWELSPKEGTVS